MNSSPQPIATRWILRLFLALTLGFALMAGYYQSRYWVWRTNNTLILEKFDVMTTQELLQKEVEVK